MDVAAWKAWTEVIGKLQATSRSGVFALTIVEDVSAAKSSVQRAAAAEYARTVRQPVAKSAIVVESGGFHSALVRSVITGMAVLAGSKYPRRVFSNAADAAWWLSGDEDALPDVPAFLLALEQLRHGLPRRIAVA